MVENFFSLCANSFVVINEPTTPNDVNFARDELRNFPSKFNVKFTTSFRSSQFEIAKFVVNFGNFKRTSETVCQKFCEMHCKSSYLRTTEQLTTTMRSHNKCGIQK